jgi:hypothetical protein
MQTSNPFRLVLGGALERGPQTFATALTSLDLDGDETIEEFFPELQSFIELCTSLQDLTLRSRVFLTLIERISPHPTLVRINFVAGFERASH